MGISKSAVIYFSIILINGVFTTFTDLKSKKIYNQHLAIGAVLGLITTFYASFINHEYVLFHFINGLAAFLFGFLMHRFALWRGGDAKLFALYAFLMPVPSGSPLVFPNAVNLFACSFIAGVIILIPLFIKDLAYNHKAMIIKLDPTKRQELAANVKMTVLFSWALFPVYHFARSFHIPIVSLVLTYLIFHLVHRYLRKRMKINYIFAGSCIAFGFLMRFWLSPVSLSWPDLPYSILRIGLYCALSACILVMLFFFKEYHERVPFAPLLFTGCVLSYTPFLTWIMDLTHLIRR